MHNSRGRTRSKLNQIGIKMRQATVTVKISKKNFASGLSYAKKFGGRLNPDKTWEIPASRPELEDLEAYYLILVEKPKVSEELEVDDDAWDEK